MAVISTSQLFVSCCLLVSAQTVSGLRPFSSFYNLPTRSSAGDSFSSLAAANMMIKTEIRCPSRLWVTNLENATKKHIEDWEIIGRGGCFYWPLIGMDISAIGILFGRKTYK